MGTQPIVWSSGRWLGWTAAGVCGFGVSAFVVLVGLAYFGRSPFSVAVPPVERRDADGRLRMRAEVHHMWPDLFHEHLPYGEGEFASWWDTGALYECCAFHGGQRNGRWCIYDAAGVLNITAEFDHGAMVGPLRCRNMETGVMYDSDVDPDFYFDTQPWAGPYEWT